MYEAEKGPRIHFVRYLTFTNKKCNYSRSACPEYRKTYITAPPPHRVRFEPNPTSAVHQFVIASPRKFYLVHTHIELIMVPSHMKVLS